MQNHIESLGIVLRTAPVKDSDLMVTLLLKSVGRCSALAKGARNSKKRFPGGIDLFDCGVFQLETSARGGSLYFINSIESRRAWIGLRANLLSFSLASLLLELVEKFSHEGDPHSAGVYDRFLPVLEQLNERDLSRGKASDLRFVVKFILELLIDSGVNPLEQSSGFDASQRANLALALQSQSDTPDLSESNFSQSDVAQSNLIGLSLQSLTAFAESHFGFTLRSMTPLLLQLIHRDALNRNAT